MNLLYPLFGRGRRWQCETDIYMSLPSPALDKPTVDTYIKAVKYGSGVTFSSVTLNMSNVASYYFVSNPSTDILRPFSGFYATFTDTSGKTKKVLLGAAGLVAGETYTEKLSNGTFDDNTTGWAANRGGGTQSSTIASSHPAGGGQSDDYLIITDIGDCGSYQQATQTVTVSSGGLYKTSIYFKQGTSGAGAACLTLIKSSGSIDILTGNTTTSWVLRSTYITIIDDDNSISYRIAKSTSTDGTALFDEASFAQVLTPSLQGIWFTPVSEDSGFLPNSATFTVAISRI